MDEEIQKRVDALVSTAASLVNRRIEETVFELLTIAGVNTLQGLKATDYEIKRCRNINESRNEISLHKGSKHIITYCIFYDFEHGKVIRERKVNDI